MISDAVGSERVSRVIGYKLTGGNFSEVTPNLPQRIVILGEVNTANQANVNQAGVQLLSAKQAGELYGYGSPIYSMMRILKPQSGDGVGGIPIFAHTQPEPLTATSRILRLEATGTATGNAIHTASICGRKGLDGKSYSFSVKTGDTGFVIATKIQDAISSVLGCPLLVTDVDAGQVELTTKWKGLTAQDVNIAIDTDGQDVGITYSVSEDEVGSGVPTVTTSLDSFGSVWNTIVINGYGKIDAIMDELETFNGFPSNELPTGRYSAITWKPFIAFTGSTDDDDSDGLDTARKNRCTIAFCPAPRSAGLQFEASANYALVFARNAQDNPHLDVNGRTLPDMPLGFDRESLVLFSNTYDNRDYLVKLGCSTATLTNGVYKIEDFVTTYAPDGESVPQFRYCRNLMLDFNVRYGYFLLEQINVVDHVIVPDEDQVAASKIVKPKQWKSILTGYAKDLSNRALIVQPNFMTDSLLVGISTTNPDRLETFFRYKRSGIARISSTTAEAGFNFGTL
jgi:phage tail sheath gpL-like